MNEPLKYLYSEIIHKIVLIFSEGVHNHTKGQT